MDNINNNETQQPQEIVIKSNSNALGIASFIFGLISIFALSIIFVPLALITGILGLIFKQYVWSALGIVCALVAVSTSPMILSLIYL